METQTGQRKISFRLPILSPRGIETHRPRKQLTRSAIKPQNDPFFRISKEAKFRLSPVTPSEFLQSKQSATPDPYSEEAPRFFHSVVKLKRPVRRRIPLQRMSLMIPEVAGIEVAETNSLEGRQTIVKAKIIQRGGSTNTLGFLSNRRTPPFEAHARGQQW